jgi:hypothetical protein
LSKALLVYRVKKRRFCCWARKKEICFGVCRIVVTSGSDEKGHVEMCPVFEERFDKIVNGGEGRG